MLTSHKVSQDIPFSMPQNQAADRAQTSSGLPFAEVFSVMFNAKPGSEENALPLKEMALHATDISSMDDFGYPLNSAMLGQEIDLSTLSLEEFQSMLPPGLQRMFNLDQSSFASLQQQFSSNVAGEMTESGLVNIGAIVKSLASMSQPADTVSAMSDSENTEFDEHSVFAHASSSARESRPVAEKVHEVLGISLPAAQVTSEMQRRNQFAKVEVQNAENEVSPLVNQVMPLSREDEVLTSVEDMTEVTLTDRYFATESEVDKSAVDGPADDTLSVDDLGAGLDIQAIDPEAYLQANSQVAETVTAESAVEEMRVDELNAGQLNNNPLPAHAVSAAIDSASAVKGNENGRAGTVMQNHSATNQVSANQTTWGSAATDSTANQGQSGQHSQSSMNQGQQTPQQANLAVQQQMQMQEQKSQAFAQQMALKTSDESLASEVSEQLNLSPASNTDKRTQLPAGLQMIQVPVKSPQWGQALAHRVSYMANQQIQQAHITLNPEKLGPIQIKLHMDRDQQVHVSMVAQNGATRESMEMAIPRLREMLEQSGMNLASVDVSDQGQAEQQQKEFEFAEKGNTDSSHDDFTATEDTNTVSIENGSQNLVDYYA